MSKRPWLYEYENGQAFGPASEESIKLYLAAKKRGVPYFNYPYFGYTKKIVVKFGAVEPLKTKEEREAGPKPNLPSSKVPLA